MDVISSHQIAEGRLSDYRILIAAANDYYAAVLHEKTEEMIRGWVQEGGIFLHGPLDQLAESGKKGAGTECQKKEKK